MQTPIGISTDPDDPQLSLETLRPGDLVYYVTGGNEVDGRIVGQLPLRIPAIRWPATIQRFCDNRPDGRADLRVYTHSGQFPVTAVPYDEGCVDHSWHLAKTRT